MIATVVTVALRSHSMALTLLCKLIVPYGHSTTFATLMTLALRSYGHPEGPSCSRNFIERSSFLKLSLYIALSLLCTTTYYHFIILLHNTGCTTLPHPRPHLVFFYSHCRPLSMNTLYRTPSSSQWLPRNCLSSLS